MATFETKDNAVWINGHEYTLTAPIRARYVDRFPAKINTGSDEYDREQFLSNWIWKDLRGGLGKEEMDESVDYDRCWWTNLNCDYSGHMLLPRLATSITPPAWLTLSNTGFETYSSPNFTGWTYDESNANFALSQESTIVDTGTYSAKITDPTGIAAGQYARLYQNAVTWDNSYRGTKITVTVRIYNSDITKMRGKLVIEDSAGEDNAYSTQSGAWETVTCTRTIASTATYLKILCVPVKIDGNTASCYFDNVGFPTVGTLSKAVEFNSNLYWAYGGTLLKLNAGRTAFTYVAAFPWTITDLCVSLNSCLYIAFGDAYYYRYMSTAEAITATTAAGGLNANKFVQYDDKLFKCNTSGTCAYATTPNSATPTWTATGGITDIASQIQTFFIGSDADGADSLYCATKSTLKILSVPSTGMANAIWIDTKLQLPNHPNGGKGATYWHDGHYISYGLGVKKYVSGSTATISEVGLDRDDGLPYEYNGEIVKLYGKSGTDVMFALVDASQVTGTGYSGLYAYTGQGWRCWWADGTADEVMYDVIVSSASSAYAVYWNAGTTIYYIDLPRGIINPSQLTGGGIVVQDSYTTGADGSGTIGTFGATVRQVAQTFTPASTHDISFVRLQLHKSWGGNPGTVTVGIYATSSGNPTGSALCSGTIDGNDITTTGLGEWSQINMTTTISLTAATKYAIVVSTAAVYPNYLYWSIDSTSATYAGGSYKSTEDGGSSWSTDGTYDCMFEEYSVTGASYYATSGTYYSPWFDGGTAVFKKLVKRLRSYARNVTSTETITIYYRTNRTITNLTDGWSLLDTLESSADNGELLNNFGSSTGLLIGAIQFKLVFARGTTTTVSPDLQSLVMAYRKLTQGNYLWTLPIVLDGLHDVKSKKDQFANIEYAVSSEYDVPVIFRRDATNETHYVKLMLPSGWNKTGDDFNAGFTLEALET